MILGSLYTVTYGMTALTKRAEFDIDPVKGNRWSLAWLYFKLIFLAKFTKRVTHYHRPVSIDRVVLLSVFQSGELSRYLNQSKYGCCFLKLVDKNRNKYKLYIVAKRNFLKWEIVETDVIFPNG